jgi:hypothetical protein
MLLFIGPQRHSLRPYLDYVGFLFQRMDPLPEQERFEVNCFLLCFHTHTNTPHSKSFSLLDRDDYFLFFPSYFFFDCFNLLCQLGYRDFLQSPLQVSFSITASSLISLSKYSFSMYFCSKSSLCTAVLFGGFLHCPQITIGCICYCNSASHG